MKLRAPNAGTMSEMASLRRLLVVSSVFPNREHPCFGTFVAERVRAYARRVEVRVVAAVPWFPSAVARAAVWDRFVQAGVPGRWLRAGRVPRLGAFDGVPVDHPRRVVIPAVGGVSSGRFYARCLRRHLAQVRREFPFDAVDSHFVWPDGYAVRSALRGAGVPYSVTVQGTDLNLMPRYPRIVPRLREVLRDAPVVISVCAALAEKARAIAGPGVRAQVVPPGVDAERFPYIDRAAARRRTGLPADGRLVVCVAHFVPRKRQELLLEAVRRLRRRAGFAEVQLAMVGDGPSRRAVIDAVRAQGDGTWVHLPGAVRHDDVVWWLSAADVFAMPSAREGWPTVFAEAHASGLPVVASDVDGNGEALTDPELGRVVPPDDVEALVEALAGVLARERDRRRLRRGAVQRSWDDVAAETLALLEAAGGGPMGAGSGSVATGGQRRVSPDVSEPGPPAVTAPQEVGG